jgi:hypothetical protein
MVRTTALHLLLGGILRFSTAGHPTALEACYVALWRLPRPDFHRQVNDDFQGTPTSARCESYTTPVATTPAATSPTESMAGRKPNRCFSRRQRFYKHFSHPTIKKIYSLPPIK